MSTLGSPFEISFEVVFRDLDLLGHVNNAVYFTYMESARTKFLTDLLSLDAPEALPFILAEATCTYHSPAFFRERLRVGVGVSRFGSTSFDLVYRIATEDGRLVAKGKTVMVMYDYKARKSCPLTDDFKQRVHAYQGNWKTPDQ